MGTTGSIPVICRIRRRRVRCRGIFVAKQTALRSTLSADDVAQAIVAMLKLPGYTGQTLLLDSGRALGTSPALLQEAAAKK